MPARWHWQAYSSEDLRDGLLILLACLLTCSLLCRTDFTVGAIFKPQQLIGIAMLLVIVDQAHIGRAGYNPVHSWNVCISTVFMLHNCLSVRSATREFLEPLYRIEAVAFQELKGVSRRLAQSTVFITPVRLGLW